MSGFVGTAIGIVIAMSVGCDIHDYKPDTRGVESDSVIGVFFVQAEKIEGVFGNGDVNSQVYRYVTKINSSDEFWSAIESQSSRQGWKSAAATASGTRCFVRLVPANSGRGFKSIYEARVHRSANGQSVTIGWVCEDGHPDPNAVGVSGVSKGFADRRVWPLVERGAKSN